MSDDCVRHVQLMDSHVGVIDRTGLINIFRDGSPIAKGPSKAIEVYSDHLKTQNKMSIVKAKYMITDACNLRCYYCYNSNTLLKRPVTLARAKQLMSRLKEQNIFLIQFHGGEPTVYPHFMDLLEYVDSIEMLSFFFTNGASPFWKREENLLRLNQLKTCPEVRVSFLAGSADKHDALAGKKGAFEMAIQTLAKLKEIGCQISISISLTNKSYDQLALVKSIAKKNNCPLHIVTEIYSYLGDGFNLSQFDVTDDEVRSARADSLGSSKVIIGERKCYNGTRSITIDSNGNVVGCERNLKKEFLNILDNSISEIVSNPDYQTLISNYYTRPSDCDECDEEMRRFCVWCPAIPENMGLPKELWKTYHCQTAKKRKLFWYGV